MAMAGATFMGGEGMARIRHCKPTARHQVRKPSITVAVILTVADGFPEFQLGAFAIDWTGSIPMLAP